MNNGSRQYTKTWRDLLESDAWHDAGINVRRFVEFLLIEEMKHRPNGQLLAPYKQLEKFGIGHRFITPTIIEAEERGLVDCHRGGQRIATTYTINWLPFPDGRMPNERWKHYRTRNNLVHKGDLDGPHNCRNDLGHKGDPSVEVTKVTQI